MNIPESIEEAIYGIDAIALNHRLGELIADNWRTIRRALLAHYLQPTQPQEAAMPTSDTERAAFEEWARSEGHEVHRVQNQWPGGAEYDDLLVGCKWAAWRAAISASAGKQS